MKLIGIKVAADQHEYLLAKMRAACEADGLTSAGLLELLLDDRAAARERQLAALANGASPFARR